MSDIIEQMAILLREDDVRRLVTIEDAIEALEFGFREWAAGRADNQPRRRVQGGVVLAVMSAALPARGLIGFKSYTVGSQGARFWVHLYDAASGAPRAVIEAHHLGRLRTGAASALATRYLAVEDTSVMTIFGAGDQAVTQVVGVTAVRPIREVRVVSRNPQRRDRFVVDLRRQRPGVKVTEATSAEQALAGSQVVTTMTTATSPILLGAWLEPGQHLNLCGSNWPTRREADAGAVARANLVVADDVDAARVEAGDLLLAEQEGHLDWQKVAGLKDAVSGKVRRSSRDQVSLFKSVGLALEDLALGATVLERAEARAAGASLPL